MMDVLVQDVPGCPTAAAAAHVRRFEVKKAIICEILIQLKCSFAKKEEGRVTR